MAADDLRFIGLMRRAGKLGTGEEGTRQAVRSRKAKLILLARDASDNAAKRAEEFSVQAGVPLVRLRDEKKAISKALGIAGGSMLAVCDEGFARALLERLRKTADEKEE